MPPTCTVGVQLFRVCGSVVAVYRFRDLRFGRMASSPCKWVSKLRRSADPLIG